MALHIKSTTLPANQRAKAAEPGRKTLNKRLARLGKPIGKSAK